ncbi:MAG: hypothetical protein H0W66_12340 [Chthoniobacterales bacterium]|nr:hypothetical protein [Chthoniobacterales bacterium]
MLLYEPPPTQGDLHFRLFGFPARVSPLFWVVTCIMGLGSGGRGTPPGELLAWVGVVFVSIVVHELGHAFVQRHFGGRPRIVLHGLGGLAICDDCDRAPRSQILISLAGPAAGFLLAAVTLALIKSRGHYVGLSWSGEILPRDISLLPPDGIQLVKPWLYWQSFPSASANTLLRKILFVNIVWGLVNLLPVYPLDGGRVAREVCTLGNPRRGVALSLQISIVAAVMMAAFAALRWQSLYGAMMFGYLAYSNYQSLQAYQRNTW